MVSTTRKIFLTTDSHFGHTKIKDYCDRPDNYEELIIKHWKHLIREQDIVYHLGDVIFGNKEQLIEVLKDLPGIKVLIKGNHDRHSDNWYIDSGFTIVCKTIRISNIILSHLPVSMKDRNLINIHGHLHNNPRKKWNKRYEKILTKNHYLFSIENTNYKPILFKDAIEKRLVQKTLSID